MLDNLQSGGVYKTDYWEEITFLLVDWNSDSLSGLMFDKNNKFTGMFELDRIRMERFSWEKIGWIYKDIILKLEDKKVETKEKKKYQIIIEVDEDEATEKEMENLLAKLSDVCDNFDVNEVGVLPIMRIIDEKEN